MTTPPRITALNGDRDGLRWGDASFAKSLTRRFTHDRLTGAVRLYRHPASGDYGRGGKYVEDRDAERIEALRRVLADA